MKPLVSIVIPTYNREKYISQAIESAINQTYDNIEIIIGDNQSTDNTWNIITEYASKDSRIHPFQNETNIGPVLNWQNCFNRAKGEFLKIIWSDDYISLDFIEKALLIFDDETAFVLSNYVLIDEYSNEMSALKKYRKIQYSVKQYLDDIFLWRRDGFPDTPCVALYRTKDVIKNFVVDIPNEDGLDSKKNGAGNDVLLYLKTVHSYRLVKIIPGTVSFLRIHPTSFSAEDTSLYYGWTKLFYLKQYKNKIYSDISKYRFWTISFKNKDFMKLYTSFHYSSLFLVSFFFLIRCYLVKYLKI